jgi:integrase
MAKITFRSLRKNRRTIDAIVGSSKNRVEISTGIKVPDYMDFIKPRTFTGGTIKERQALEDQLFAWEASIRNKYTSMEATQGKSFTRDTFRYTMKSKGSELRNDDMVDVRTTLSGFICQTYKRIESGLFTKKSDGRPYKKNTLGIIEGVLKRAEDFITTHGDFDFGKYNLEGEKVLGRNVVLNAYDDFCEGLKAYYIKEKYGDRTIGLSLSTLKQIILDRAEYHGINISKRHLSKMSYRDKTPTVVVALSDEQFEWLLNNEEKIRDDNKLVKWAQRDIDYLIAGMLTSLRISDLSLLTSDNLLSTPDGIILSVYPQKTSGIKVEIPVMDRLVEIFKKNIEKYEGKLLPPMLYINDISRCVRKILKQYPLFQNLVQVKSPRGKLVTKPFWKAFRFHSTRASLITYLLSHGEQETAIKSISGHTLDSKSFKAYTNIVNSLKVRVMQRIAMIGIEKGAS